MLEHQRRTRIVVHVDGFTIVTEIETLSLGPTSQKMFSANVRLLSPASSGRQDLHTMFISSDVRVPTTQTSHFQVSTADAREMRQECHEDIFIWR